MRRMSSFLGTIAFGGVAAALWLPFQFAVAPLVGTVAAAQLYLSALATSYAAALAPRGARRLGIAAVVLAANTILCVLTMNVAATAAGLTAIIALARSLLLSRANPVRALARETVLGSAALGLAAFLVQGPWLSFSLGLWGYFLVQSLFFVTRESVRNPDRCTTSDPFDSAIRQAFAVLDGE